MNIDKAFIAKHNRTVGNICDILESVNMSAEEGEALLLYIVGMSVAVHGGDATKIDLQPLAYGHNVAQLGLASGEL